MNLTWSRRKALQPATADENHYMNLWADEKSHHRDTAVELATARRTCRVLGAEVTRLVELVDRLTNSSVDADIAVGDALRDHERWHNCTRRSFEKEPAPSFPAKTQPQQPAPTAVYTPSAAGPGDLL